MSLREEITKLEKENGVLRQEIEALKNRNVSLQNAVANLGYQLGQLSAGALRVVNEPAISRTQNTHKQ